MLENKPQKYSNGEAEMRMTVQHQTVGCFIHRPTKTRSRHVRESWEQERLHPSRLELVCKHVCSHTLRYVNSGCGMIAVDLTAALLPVRTAHVQAATSQGTLTSCQALAVIEICNLITLRTGDADLRF